MSVLSNNINVDQNISTLNNSHPTANQLASFIPVLPGPHIINQPTLSLKDQFKTLRNESERPLSGWMEGLRQTDTK